MPAGLDLLLQLSSRFSLGAGPASAAQQRASQEVPSTLSSTLLNTTYLTPVYRPYTKFMGADVTTRQLPVRSSRVASKYSERKNDSSHACGGGAQLASLVSQVRNVRVQGDAWGSLGIRKPCHQTSPTVGIRNPFKNRQKKRLKGKKRANTI